MRDNGVAGTDDIEHAHLDVLQNIEFAIVGMYRADAALHPLYMRDAVDAWRTPTTPGKDSASRQLPTWPTAPGACSPQSKEYVSGGWAGGPSPAHAGMPGTVIPVAMLGECLRRIQKSVLRWSGYGGRRGYLEFVSRYVP